MMYASAITKEPRDFKLISDGYNLTKDTVIQIAKEIVKKENCFFNIIIPDSFLEFDMFVSHKYINQSAHKKGIINYEVLIGIIGYGFYGFKCEKENKNDQSYYKQKIGIKNELLTDLINNIRNEVFNSLHRGSK